MVFIYQGKLIIINIVSKATKFPNDVLSYFMKIEPFWHTFLTYKLYEKKK